jgi:hypothetical protein
LFAQLFICQRIWPLREKKREWEFFRPPLQLRALGEDSGALKVYRMAAAKSAAIYHGCLHPVA